MGIRRTTTAIAMLAVTTGFGSVVAVQDTPRDLQDPEFPEDGFYLTSLTRYRSQSLTGVFGRMVRYFKAEQEAR